MERLSLGLINFTDLRQAKTQANREVSFAMPFGVRDRLPVSKALSLVGFPTVLWGAIHAECHDMAETGG